MDRRWTVKFASCWIKLSASKSCTASCTDSEKSAQLLGKVAMIFSNRETGRSEFKVVEPATLNHQLEVDLLAEVTAFYCSVLSCNDACRQMSDLAPPRRQEKSTS